MAHSDLHMLLQQNFSLETLERDPALLLRALHLVRDCLAPEGKAPYPATPFETLAGSFAAQPWPQHGIGADAFLDDLQHQVLQHTAQLNHPMFIGHMTQALPWFSVAIEAITAALNQNQVKVETAYASTLVEKQVLGWLHRKVYRNDEAFYETALRAKGAAIGNAVSGGTLGNLTALAVALETSLPGSRKEGLHTVLARSGYAGLAVVGSQRLHYSMKKAMATLGMGENALHLVPVDSEQRIDLDRLEDTLDELRRRRIKVVALVGIAGTTETGAIDPLAELAAIARREGAWFHVDAAWGGALLVADRFRDLYAGVEFSDSIVIDGHKLFWVPMAQGMVLFRDPASLERLKHNANYIIRSNSADLGQTTLEGSRRFDALKLWASLKIFGESGYDALLTRVSEVASTMRALVLDQQDFELTSDSSTFILTYRYMPRAWRQRMSELLAAGRLDEAAALNRRLNVLNSGLQDRQKQNGKSFVSRTVLELAPFPEGVTVLRAVLTNVHTTAAHLRAVLHEQRELGERLMQELELEPQP